MGGITLGVGAALLSGSIFFAERYFANQESRRNYDFSVVEQAVEDARRRAAVAEDERDSTLAWVLGSTAVVTLALGIALIVTDSGPDSAAESVTVNPALAPSGAGVVVRY